MSLLPVLRVVRRQPPSLHACCRVAAASCNVACSACCPAHQSLGGFRCRKSGYRCAGRLVVDTVVARDCHRSRRLQRRRCPRRCSHRCRYPLRRETCSLGALTLAAETGGCASPCAFVEGDVARHDDLAVVGQDAVALHVGLVAHHDAADGVAVQLAAQLLWLQRIRARSEDPQVRHVRLVAVGTPRETVCGSVNFRLTTLSPVAKWTCGRGPSGPPPTIAV